MAVCHFDFLHRSLVILKVQNFSAFLEHVKNKRIESNPGQQTVFFLALYSDVSKKCFVHLCCNYFREGNLNTNLSNTFYAFHLFNTCCFPEIALYPITVFSSVKDYRCQAFPLKKELSFLLASLTLFAVRFGGKPCLLKKHKRMLIELCTMAATVGHTKAPLHSDPAGCQEYSALLCGISRPDHSQVKLSPPPFLYDPGRSVAETPCFSMQRVLHGWNKGLSDSFFFHAQHSLSELTGRRSKTLYH